MCLPIKLKMPEHFFEEEVRDGYAVSRTQKKIWAVELDLLNELQRVCKKHNLRLQVFYGTLLGAIRHKGFIPWDDDLDVCLERMDFEKLQEVAQKEFSHPYFFQTALSDRHYFCPYGRLRNSDTTGAIAWTADPDYNNGIYVDVYVYDKCPQTRLMFCIFHFLYRLCCSLMRIHSYNGHCASRMKDWIYRMLRPVVRVFSFSFLYRIYLALLAANEKSSKVGFLYEPQWGVKFDELFDLSDIEKTIEWKYENLTVPVISCYDKYLTRSYGDYTRFPAIEERGAWHEGKIHFDPDISYKEYFRRLGIIPKSINLKVAFTFDDGLKDHILYAAPLLEKYGYKGMFCITTDFIGRDRYLTWDDVRELKRRGHEIAAHSVSHQNLYDLLLQGRTEEIKREIVEAKTIIETETSSSVRYFAFPYNACNGQLFKMVRAEGMEPLSPHRINLGGAPANPVEELGVFLCGRAAREKYAILMFHGIADQKAYAYYPECSGLAFEKRLIDVKKYDGVKYVVVNYADYTWPIRDMHFLPYRVYNKLCRTLGL